MIVDVPSGYEAHKLISISLGKIAASRSGRTGASLHKSLLVASVLHKARYVYFEEAQHFQSALFGPPQDQTDEYGPEPPRASTPLPEVTVTPIITTDNNHEETENNIICDSNRLVVVEPINSESVDDEGNLIMGRKRRRVSEQEIEAAVSSILPKRHKFDSETDKFDSKTNNYDSETVVPLAPPEEVDEDTEQTLYENDQDFCSSCCYKSSACRCSDDICNMEVDHITSLVSIFSFNKQKQTTDSCYSPVHHPSETVVGPPTVALTA